MTRVPAASFERPSLLDHARSLAAWSSSLSFCALTLPPLTVLSKILGSPSIEPLNRWYCRNQIRSTGTAWRSEVDPAVDPTQPYMFLQNHTNLLDHVWLYDATPHFKQGLELAAHFDYPIYGWFMRARGTIPVEPFRGGQTATVMQRMRDEVARGHSILAFPEGTRTLDGRVGTFRKGTVFLARDLELPIVPTSVTGAFEVVRKGGWIVRPGHTVTVYCDAPVATKGLPDSAIPELTKHVESIVRRRVDAYWRERGWQGEEASCE